jgi:hypothetical protein
MSSNEEWKQFKLECLEHLRASSFQLADYTAPSTEWDHDHCESCRATFAEFDAPKILHSGYFTIFQVGNEPPEEPKLIQESRELGRNVMKKPDSKEWVCQECFEEFRKTLDWKLESRAQI